ncbi:MAG: hypothetical protein ACI8P3_002700 [Saprospiraceae bacterium]|jgi:hypothetical protein
MNMPNEAAIKMEYIQQLFLGVQDFMQKKPDLEELIVYLDAIPGEFRSVAYESASMEIGLYDLSKGTQLPEWEQFYFRSGEIHSFHLDIGLGWAFAKTGTFPAPIWEPLHPLMRWMIFDGMGYYHGLFKGRRTVKKQLIPEGVEGQDRQGYDQGLGRRLWYIAKGEVKDLVSLIQPFPSLRHPDLWRGVGIACGYVGGNKKANLELLSAASGEWKPQLCTGIALAAMSRNTSESVNGDIKEACQFICKMNLEEIVNILNQIISKPDVDTRLNAANWINQLESAFK